MATNPITNETSLKSKPQLRLALIGTWLVVTLYTISVYAMSVPVIFWLRVSDPQTSALDLSQVLFTVTDMGIDIFIAIGFLLTAVYLFTRRSDDWFVIFTSMFLVTFAGRISNTVNNAFFVPGYEFWTGLLIALGDFFVLLFCLLFPEGKFSPRWVRFTIPLLVITLVGLYLVPDFPFYRQKLGTYTYMSIMLAWYLFGVFTFSWRYRRQKNLLQRQQTLWVMIGLLGPLVWFIFFNGVNAIFNLGIGSNNMSAWLYGFIGQVVGIFLFLMLPVSITISIARSKLFDIDLLINRSLVYLSLTIGLGIVFAGVLVGVSFFFRNIEQGDQSILAVAVSALAAGALFQPARRRLQRFVDQFFYRIKIDYQKTPVELRKTDNPLEDTTLSSYRGLKLIGRGGMADVYRAESPTKGREVAIKVLPPTFAADDQFRRRFMREAEIVAGLQHSNIVEILNYGEENGTYYIVMEYLTGPDFRALLKENKRIPLDDFVPLLRDTVSALEYAHARGLVHRDIKPSNVMLDTTSLPLRAVLTDFGIAKIADAHTKITATGVLGTFDYIAPEQIQSSAEVDAAADQYALGVMTYQMLTGKLPFERPNTGALLLAHLTAPPPDIRELVPETPRHVAYAIQRAMAKNPKDRYPNVQEFFQAIESASQTQ
jgi:tRNA A-37 threonylcarbamoyl transferase component Bud32